MLPTSCRPQDIRVEVEALWPEDLLLQGAQLHGYALLVHVGNRGRQLRMQPEVRGECVPFFQHADNFVPAQSIRIALMVATVFSLAIQVIISSIHFRTLIMFD